MRYFFRPVRQPWQTVWCIASLLSDTSRDGRSAFMMSLAEFSPNSKSLALQSTVSRLDA